MMIFSVRPLLLVLCCLSPVSAQSWQTIELPVKLSVGYAVRAIDINGDKQLDIAIVDSKRVLWLENPSWQEHVIYATPEAKADNVCFAPHDVDGDGWLDLALGADWQPNNTDSGGSIGWLRQYPAGTWTYYALTSQPTTHRMNWVELSKGQKSLVVAPLKGAASKAPGFDQTGVKLLAFTPPAPDSVTDASKWQSRVLNDQLHVMHNFQACDLDADNQVELLCASYEGASWLRLDLQGHVSQLTQIGIGQQQSPPARGASEIRHGQLANGTHYVATIEPWHGDKVVVYVAPQAWQSQTPWPRLIIDEQLAWGHAVACANLDDDPADELVIGVRDNQTDAHRCGVRVYDPDASGQTWTRTLIDAGGVAVEDLIVADFNNDGRNDIVAVGRATHNAKLYLQ